MGRLLASRVYLLEFNCSLVTPGELDDTKLVFSCSSSLAEVALHSLSWVSVESSMILEHDCCTLSADSSSSGTVGDAEELSLLSTHSAAIWLTPLYS